MSYELCFVYSDPMEVSTMMITRCSALYSGTMKVCAAHVHRADVVRALIRVQRRDEGHVEVLELDDEHGVVVGRRLDGRVYVR